MDTIQITNDIRLQIELGERIFHAKQSVYTDSVVQSINECIERCYPNFRRKELTKRDLFYISIYDYWTVGCTVAEGLYYRFIDKTFEEKKEFITLRDRLVYTNILNDKKDAHLLTNKYEAYEILKPLYKREVIRICTPEDFETFKDFVSRNSRFVAKPEGASMSIGVHLVDTNECADLYVLFLQLLKEGQDSHKLCSWCDSVSVVLEEIIEQSDIMSAPHPASINNLRCISIRRGDDVEIFYPCVKIGMNNEFICSGASGSLIAAVDPQTGVVLTNGKTETLQEYDIHPDTGVRISGFQIPDWEGVKSIVREAALQFPTMSFIGWDVVHSKKGWCIMEGNFATEFVCCQLPNQRGFKEKFESLVDIHLDPYKLWWK